ncbi:hypothetical protein ACFWWT_36105 [Streptomyces sp. NPDC058676]|uniref:hypothetical protein n=1 Tax=unclassified Streptomyces TaxID=2593676 RepID=UPI00365BFB33
MTNRSVGHAVAASREGDRAEQEIDDCLTTPEHEHLTPRAAGIRVRRPCVSCL